MVGVTKKLFNINVIPLITICDQGTTNRKAIKCLMRRDNNDELFKPLFMVNGKEIIAIFDPPHLLKSTRNDLFKYTNIVLYMIPIKLQNFHILNKLLILTR